MTFELQELFIHLDPPPSSIFLFTCFLPKKYNCALATCAYD